MRAVRDRERGMTEMEMIMIIAAFVLPLYVGVRICNYMLRYYYHHIAFSVLLPFP